MEDKDNPAFAFSGETKDWPAFKDATQLSPDHHDTTWLFEVGRELAEFFARQLKEKTGTRMIRTKAIEREVAKNDNNHVPTSVDAYTVATLKEWFEDKDIATGLQLSLNKNLLTSLGSNFTDHKKLGFKDEAALAKVHKSIDLKYLRQFNRMVTRLLHDAVFEPLSKVDTPAQSKLNGILRNSEVSQLLFSRRRRRGMTCSAVEDPRSADLGQDVPQVRGHDRHANGHHDGRATIITCVTGDAHHRRTIYEADQDFERFGKTLIANFKDTATLWEFLRASLRQ